MSKFESLSLFFSVISLFSVALLGLRGNAIQKRVLRLEEDRRNDEKKLLSRADLRAEIIKEGKEKKLLILNNGKAVAENINILIDGELFQEHSMFVKGQMEGALRLEAGGLFRYLISTHLGMKPMFEIEIKWDDESEKGRASKSMLSIF